MSKLIIEDLRLSYGDVEVLKGVDLAFEEGDVVCLLGRSGSGKTTLLRAIAGLQDPSGGAIRIDGKTVYDSRAGINIPSEKRGLGLVFQSYALWPHKTVFDNIAYALKLRGIKSAEIRTRVMNALKGVELDGLQDRYPHQLSGGQQQRVALVRALAYEPPVILLDEPLSNLDAKLREDARLWIRDIIRSLRLTAVFVTHDQVEAMAICDKIVLLDKGMVVQLGGPEELYNNPKSLFAAEFMGANNQFRSAIAGRRKNQAEIKIEGRSIFGENRSGKDAGADAVGVIRVDRVSIVDGESENCLPAKLETSLYLGGYYENVFSVGTARIRHRGAKLAPKESYWLRLPPEDLWIF
jgi:iron(III) transport system ATP-binding protein